MTHNSSSELSPRIIECLNNLIRESEDPIFIAFAMASGSGIDAAGVTNLQDGEESRLPAPRRLSLAWLACLKSLATVDLTPSAVMKLLKSDLLSPEAASILAGAAFQMGQESRDAK